MIEKRLLQKKLKTINTKNIKRQSKSKVVNKVAIALRWINNGYDISLY